MAHLTYPEPPGRIRRGAIELRQDTHAPAQDAERADTVAERVAEIIDAAERAAEALRNEAEDRYAARIAEAEREAARVLDDAQRRADREVADARELLRELVERATRLVRRLDAADAGPEEEPAPERHPPRPARLEPIEEARLMALQMAMAGRTRAEAEADLRHGLRVADPEPVLDDVFGKGTPGSQRIPWSGVSR